MRKPLTALVVLGELIRLPSLPPSKFVDEEVVDHYSYMALLEEYCDQRPKRETEPGRQYRRRPWGK
ncbi:hypothetical protein PG988_016252 [Apiospora saccharicola]